MACSLHITSGRRKAAAKPTLVDQIDSAVETLHGLRRIAANERRSTEQHDDLVDALREIGFRVARLGRV